MSEHQSHQSPQKLSGQVQMESDGPVICDSKPHLPLHTQVRLVHTPTSQEYLKRHSKKADSTDHFLLSVFSAGEMVVTADPPGPVCLGVVCVCVSSVTLHLILAGKVSLLIPGTHQLVRPG